jgi:murein DD-endopeptidase MepM/ murein hydrolase activator NlpD/cell division protein FtsL
MKNKKRKLVFLAISIFVLLTLAVSGLSLSARLSTQEQEIQRERQQLQRNIRETQQSIANANRELSRAEREMQDLDEQIMQVLDDMLIIDETIEIVGERFERAVDELEEARVYRDGQELIVRERLRALHEHGQPSLLDVLVQSTSVRNFMLNMEWMVQIARQDQRMLQRLEDAEVRYLASVEDVARQRSTLDSLMISLTRSHAELEFLMEQWQERHDSLMAEKQTFEQMLATDQARERTLAEREAELRREREAQEEAARLRAMANLQGELLWPVPGFMHISSGYGNRPNPFNRRVTQFHSGIDIAGAGIRGANVVAAKSGYVITAADGWNGGYGTWVIIDHGDGLVTRYAHLLLSSITVTVGQYVRVGDVIGRVGSTGQSTGPHLHFEVRVYGQHQNPGPFLGLRN